MLDHLMHPTPVSGISPATLPFLDEDIFFRLSGGHFRLRITQFSHGEGRRGRHDGGWQQMLGGGLQGRGNRDVMAWTWWRHQIEIFSALLALCTGNSPVTGEFPSQRPVTRSFDVFFDLCLNNLLSNNGEAGDLRRHRAHYDVIVMEMISKLLVFCEANPPNNRWITPKKETSNAELLLYCQSGKTVKQIVEFPVICGVMCLMWRHCYVVTYGKVNISGAIFQDTGAATS